MRNLKITIEYDGTNYCGWQIQKNGNSIQSEISNALNTLTGQNVTINGAGRTDAKVHALGQTANFYINCSIPTEKFSAALNSKLPKDIVVTKTVEVPKNFHARFSAIGKQYEYKIYNHSCRSAIKHNYVWHFPSNLDIDRMKDALQSVVGTHDFSQFMASGSDVKDTVRTITRAEIRRNAEEKEISVIFEGDGFLYKMVRMLVAAIIKIGVYKSSKEELEARLFSQQYCQNKWTAPPEGLFLNKVYYDKKDMHC
ncbi:tRNA pseudouridine38-40 synthase [Tindallia magadiensis]|uniref:tRNA pseudouridine synthase A n=1 Tax=Tindallia magadiensis TaxID=69895 RepID=A0A1I3HIG3_9FIRM|nr:tRNA pseudouridine(38-40) synthase TruA [Tindallia magadiensis]SFI35409.1 tRNA pseudouridine38-40 synthase [Tindallia magadiensis]